jgi:hypothetical protein
VGLSVISRKIAAAFFPLAVIFPFAASAPIWL